MLEAYEKFFDAETFIKTIMVKNQINRTEAMKLCRRKIPKESYYQEKIKKAVKKSYPDAFVRKICQGSYSEGGIPDIMVVWHGHYFGFEVKRPLVGKPSALQLATIEQIRKSGGTAEIVTWPEQALQVINDWDVMRWRPAVEHLPMCFVYPDPKEHY